MPPKKSSAKKAKSNNSELVTTPKKTKTKSKKKVELPVYSEQVMDKTNKKQPRRVTNPKLDSDDDATDSDIDLEDQVAELEELDETEKTQFLNEIENKIHEENFKHEASINPNVDPESPDSPIVFKGSELLERENLIDLLNNAKREVRAAHAENLGKIAQDRRELLLCCIKQTSQKQYQSNKNTVIKQGFRWSVAGLYGFFTSKAVALRVSNTYCYSILSTFKLLYAIENDGLQLESSDEFLLRLTLRSRKNLVPDMPRIVGAITYERLGELHTHYRDKLLDGTLSQEDYDDLVDVSNCLYGCALRIFQLRSLTEHSFWFSPTKEDVAWVSVPAKVTKQGRFTESKLINPKFIPILKDIIERRKSSNTTLFPRWEKMIEGSDASRLKLESLMKDLNAEAANLFNWPSLTSFHGTHNFRHGAAQDSFAEGGTKLVMMRTGHLSEHCASYYARSDLERDRRSAFANLAKSRKESEVLKHLQDIKKSVDKMRQNHQLDELDLVSFDDGIKRPNPANLEEAELENLLLHVEEQEDTQNDLNSNRRRRRRKRLSNRRQRQQTSNEEEVSYFNPYTITTEQLAWDPKDLEVVNLRMSNGELGLFRLPKQIASKVHLNAPMTQVKQWMDDLLKETQPLQTEQTVCAARYDFLYKSSYPQIERFKYDGVAEDKRNTEQYSQQSESFRQQMMRGTQQQSDDEQ